MRACAHFFAVIIFSALTPVAIAQLPDEPRIREVITRQLEAMNRGDDAAAFAIASPAIQTMFQNAPTFMRMVQMGYPQVYRSRSHRFLKLDTSDGRLSRRTPSRLAHEPHLRRSTWRETLPRWALDPPRRAHDRAALESPAA